MHTIVKIAFVSVLALFYNSTSVLGDIIKIDFESINDGVMGLSCIGNRMKGLLKTAVTVNTAGLGNRVHSLGKGLNTNGLIIPPSGGGCGTIGCRGL